MKPIRLKKKKKKRKKKKRNYPMEDGSKIEKNQAKED